MVNKATQSTTSKVIIFEIYPSERKFEKNSVARRNPKIASKNYQRDVYTFHRKMVEMVDISIFVHTGI